MSASKITEATGESEPRVSVVVPAYNAETNIGSCLDALIHQTYPRDLYEIIVIDDGSRDATAETVKEYSVRYFCQENKGPAAARNHGAQQADGEILLFTDADCIPDTNWIEEMLKPFQNARIAAVKGAYRNENQRLLARFAQIEFEERYALLSQEESIDMIDTYSAGYRKEIFDAMGGFDSSFPCANNEDTELSYRLAARHHLMVFNPNAIVRHLGHPDTVARYFRLKFGRGYWRMVVYKQFPEKMIRDTYTPQSLKLQIITLFLVAIFLPVPFLFGTWGLIFPLGAALAFIFFSVPFMRFAWGKDTVVGLCSPFLIAMRAASLGLGAAWGILHHGFTSKSQ